MKIVGDDIDIKTSDEYQVVFIYIVELNACPMTILVLATYFASADLICARNYQIGKTSP